MTDETIEKKTTDTVFGTTEQFDATPPNSVVTAEPSELVAPGTASGDDSVATTISYRLRKPNYSLTTLMCCLCVILICYISAEIFYTSRIPVSTHSMVGMVSLIALFGIMIAALYFSEKAIGSLLSITIGERAIRFSKQWKIEMLNRLERDWDDVQSIELLSLAAPVKRSFLTSQTLHDSVYGPKLFIDFASGGSASVNLNLLNDQQKNELLKALSQRVPLTKFNGAAVRLKEQLMSEISNASYTDMWIDDVSMRHASTNFEPLPAGYQLRSGKIRIIAELASGGLSAIYLVETEDGRSKAVLKESVLPLDMSDELKAKAREHFHREAQVLSALNHPNIVKVHDFFVERGRDYLLLQHIAGQTIRQVVAEGRLDERRAVELATKITDIVNYLHEQEPPIVHRDLTPDNILVRDDGEVVLIDFGAANQFVGQATGTMVGKKSYIPPEQFRGKAQPASDIYAFGATLFFMLTGNDPVALSTSTLPPELKVSDKLRSIVTRCTEIEARDRFENIEQVKSALLETLRVSNA